MLLKIVDDKEMNSYVQSDAFLPLSVQEAHWYTGDTTSVTCGRCCVVEMT